MFAIKDSNRFIAIPNPLNSEFFYSTADVFRKEKEALFVGRIIEPVKRLSYILQAWKILRDNGKTKDWKLTIVGDGIDLEYIKNLSQKLLCDNVYFEGRKDPAEYYRRAAIFVMTSSFEGWGMTLVEAQQSGCVPVAMDSYASLREIIQDGVNGVIVPNNDIPAFADAMKRLMSNDEYRRRLAAGGLETCKRFSIDHVIGQWEALFSEVVTE